MSKNHLRKLHPNKSLGQNFLIDKNVLKKIVEAADLNKNDTVIEIGAGTGVLTQALAERANQVIALEVDKKLVVVLKENFKNYENVEIIENDVLRVGARFIASNEQGVINHAFTTYKVVANIPYNITSAILEKFLSAAVKPTLIVLLVQKEVAERVCASPRPNGRGKPGKMSVLSVMAQFYGQPESVDIVPATAFYPQPKVESAILKIITKPNKYDEIFIKHFFRIVKIGFKQKRKMLKNNLRGLASVETIKNVFKHLKLLGTIRAEDMTINQWLRLAQNLG